MPDRARPESSDGPEHAEPAPLRPLPETAVADDLYGPFLFGDHDLVDRLVVLAQRVRVLVPELVGLSLSLVEHGATFTVVATNDDVALLDAVQYVDGGPCADALAQQDVVITIDPPEIDRQWGLFGAAARANGVASTLSLPVLGDGERVGGFNIYASVPHAFESQVESVAEVLGVWAHEAHLDGDLGFGSRELARRAPIMLRESSRLAVAASLLARARHIDVQDATERLRRSAVRAAVPLPWLVDQMIGILQGLELDDPAAGDGSRRGPDAGP